MARNWSNRRTIGTLLQADAGSRFMFDPRHKRVLIVSVNLVAEPTGFGFKNRVPHSASFNSNLDESLPLLFGPRNFTNFSRPK